VKFAERPTGDLLVLAIAGTVCFTVLATVATLGVVEIFDSGRDTSSGVNAITDVINTLIGLLAGFLAGRGQAAWKTPGSDVDGPPKGDPEP